MSFLITRKPEKWFNGTSKFSRWTALANPYIFELTRADFQVANTAIRNAYSTTLPTIWLPSADPLILDFLINVGDEIYVNSGMYNGVYTVAGINGQYITINTPFIGNGSSGWINVIEVFTNFKAIVNIYDGVTGQIIDTIYPKPDSTGLLLCDVSGIIRSIVDTQTVINQTAINKPNKGISGSFTIGYGATYKLVLSGSTTDQTIAEVHGDELYYWISAARQIVGDVTLGMDGIGQNMKEYVPKNISGTAAKFLTMFERPTYFENFPFFLSFIYDEDFKAVYLERHQQDVNVNGTNVGSETDNNLFITGIGYVNQMNVRTPNATASGFDVWLETGGVIVDGYTTEGYVNTGYTSIFAAPFP